ncbi:MAG: exodeoxyribonuclease V subunit gamma [Burkholderiaceae bacterium]
MPRSTIQPGLLVLHGNRLEYLRDAVFEWLARSPLEPLEEEIFLVQSNGAAEWLKMSIARDRGICAATRVELPGRFLWRAYRQVLGRLKVPAQSALEREALAWRLMRLLPELVELPVFAPVAAFLSGSDPDRRLQLARRLADLYDQYQVYRTDWLAEWAVGRPLLPGRSGASAAVPVDQRWQVTLWRSILGELSGDERASTRPAVHDAFIDALRSGADPVESLPRRVVLFGASHISTQGLQALAALSSRIQVILAVPNPCRYYWADIIEGRDAWHALRHRHPAQGTRDLSAMPLEAMHLHAHPLLAAWGRQGRDFMRALDVFDDAADARRRFDLPRIDVFDDRPGTSLLEQVQANIRDLVPLPEHPGIVIDADDRSIVFQIAHGAQREVEILHDRLLEMFAATDGDALRPRDVVAMVPDIETFAPAIRAVFGQYRRDDARFIPFDIADLESRGSDPLVVALEWLLRIPEKRVRLQEVRDLLDVPAIARRLDIDCDALPGLFSWLSGAGVRWGLNEAHRADLGLAATGDQNSWAFGLRRMLLGYATGVAPAFADIEPYDEIGGLDASAVGSLAAFADALDAWWTIARSDATPAQWATRGRDLLATFVAPTDERERLTVAALQASLSAWLEACETARFAEKLPLSVMREAWLSGVDDLDASRRFLTGGVTFCTLMPLRSVPFEVVCLLGMNDGDFPRQGRRDDFDLMALPGQQRPGDRSRREDDRYLMLEALLSARRALYVSWCGRSARDNSEQPPSVLVSQLRDYLAVGWHGPDGRDVLADRTTVHPLQPFSRRYFEGGALRTYAREWRAAHAGTADAVVVAPARGRFEPGDVPLTMAQLVRFLRNPVREFFRARLDIRVPEDDEAFDEDEAFGINGLTLYGLCTELLADPASLIRDGIDAGIENRLARLRGSGRLPMFALGSRVVDELAATIRPMLAQWQVFDARYPLAAERTVLRVAFDGLAIDDWLDGLRSDGERCIRLDMTASRLLDADGKTVRTERLVGAWVRMLVENVCGQRTNAVLIGPDATLELDPDDPETARTAFDELIQAWRDGMGTPLPFALRTSLAFAGESGRSHAIYDGDLAIPDGEGREFCLQRTYPDYEALIADGGFEHYAAHLFAPMHAWARSRVVIVPHAAAGIVTEGLA